MNLDRLQILIDVMQRVVDNNGGFDITTWQDFGADGIKKTEKELNNCGSSACVIGWLAVSPEFQALGGEVDSVGDGVFNDYTSFRALAEFLECSDSTALAMSSEIEGSEFYDVDPEDITAEVVVERLKEFKETIQKSHDFYE